MPLPALSYAAFGDQMTAGEIVGAVASVLGGLIGAAGAAVAVYLTLAGQRKEDRERIRGALVREVIEFARLVVGHLDTCEHIRAGIIKMPVPKLAQEMQMPAPIIYPAVADKIGLLKSPQHVVAFYMRITEIAIMAQAVADDPKLQMSFLQDNNVRLIVEALLDICQFATWIIQDSKVQKQEFIAFDKAVSASILSDMDGAIKQARKNFRIEATA